MVQRALAFCLALLCGPIVAQEAPLLPPDTTETKSPAELSPQAMQAKEIERLLAGPKNNAAAIEAITTAEPPGQAIADGAKSVAKTAIAPAVTSAATTAGTAAVSGVVGAVAAPALILGGIAVVGAGVACAQFCDQK